MTMKQIQSHQCLREVKVWYQKNGTVEYKITSSRDAFKYLVGLYNKDQLEYRESFYALYLNRSNYVIGWSRISDGGIASTVADGKIIFGQALKVGASGIILSHNHPSQLMQPSNADITLTKRFERFGKMIDLIVMDHIIINGNQNADTKFVSMIDEGVLK